MQRFFNTAGPCEPERHFMLPPLARLEGIQALIDRSYYFVVHAPRQTGKTTALIALARELTASGKYAAAVVSCESGQPFKGNVGKVEAAILSSWQRSVQTTLAPEFCPPPWPDAPEGSRIEHALDVWARGCPRPLVVFMDEIDALADESLISILRQLRSGYVSRPDNFPHTVALVGLRDVRDYRARIRDEIESMGTASPFNIKSDSLMMGNFSEEDVAQLYMQHTEETGQVFEPAAMALAFETTGGQPWLVNALARQLVEREVPDPKVPITPVHVEAAKESLIERRDTHLDSLADKLREARVRRVIEPILAGTTMPMDTMNDDLLYVRDLGLITGTPPLRIANPIYQEVIPRTLTYIMQANIPNDASWYLKPDGSLDMHALLRAFQEFFAEHSEFWLERYDYKEAGPHLVLMAFLQRIVNGGGQLHREFAVASGRADLLAEWHGQRYAFELKIRRGERTLQQGITQLSGYLERLQMEEGFLILFDRRKEVSWDDKIYEKEVEGVRGRRIFVFGA